MAGEAERLSAENDGLSPTRRAIASTVDVVETFFDRLKLSYKWGFNRFFHLNVITYRGFGPPDRVWFRGRVLDDRAVTESPHDSIWQNVRTTLRRIETDEIPGATVRVRFYDVDLEVQTDEDGFFDVWLEASSIEEDRVWHNVQVDLLRPQLHSRESVRSMGQVLIPPREAEFGVISDIDDTVIRSGAYNRLQFGRVVLLNSSRTRTPFPGVASFYRALQQGPNRAGINPIFYLSSSPWNLYHLFDDFMEAHDVPVGPILLRDYGFSDEKLFKSSHESHKTLHILQILDAFPDLPFVLVGDSGQRDPEIYQQIVQERPDRIRAVFIRDVTPPGRDNEVHEIAAKVDSLGVPMKLLQHSDEAAREAAELGLVTGESLEEVEASQRRESRQKKSPGLIERLLR